MHEDAAVSETIFSLVFALFNLFFITAGFIQMCANNLERHGFSFSDSRDADKAITFDDALYFVVVTFTTVGYGDMLPTGHGSRALMVVFIIVAFTIIPSRVADLAEAIKLRSPYAHDVGKMTNHVIVTGGMTVNNLSTFLDELFNDDHEGDTMEVSDAVLLFQTSPSPELVAFLNEHPKAHQLSVLRGSAFVRDDLVDRCRAASASGIFVLIDQQATDMNVVDAEVTIYLALVASASSTFAFRHP